MSLKHETEADLIKNLDETDADSFVLSDKVRKAIKTLWKEEAVQDAWKRANETQVLESAAYFFEDIDRLDHDDYTPSTDDILRARQKTTGMSLSLWLCLVLMSLV